MTVRSLIPLAFLSCLPALAQPTPASPTFLAADVHPAPRRTYPFYNVVLLPPDRYVIRDATMVDLVATAYDLDPANVQAGPAWLEYDRYDIDAKIPPNTAKPTLKLMLRALLAERFHLTLHNGSAPIPAYILTAAKTTKLKSPAAPGEFACDNVDQPGSLNLIHCHNANMDDLAAQLMQVARGYLDRPVINSTHLEGAFDFDLKWNNRHTPVTADDISIFDAVDKQLGLKLTLETAPRPVVLVDNADEKPTPNPPDIAKVLPPPAPKEFEVATLKPTKPGTRGNGNITHDKVDFADVPLRLLIDLAWDLNESDHAKDNIVNAPKWLDDDHYDLMAKLPEGSGGSALKSDTPVDIYEVELMLRALLIERFQLKAHLEDRPTDAYTLLPGMPRLKPADPTVRTACVEGPGPDGKDPRKTDPVLNRLITCRNMTLSQICDELQRVAGGYLQNPVLDQTGIKGSFDFTLSFSSIDRLPHATTPSDDIDTAPNGAVSLFTAVNKQLGLKLEKQKRPLPVLVIDHIEQKPIEN